MSGPACGFHFVEGERYVVFASKSHLGLHVSFCSRTQPAKYAAEDIAYLRSLPSLPKRQPLRERTGNTLTIQTSYQQCRLGLIIISRPSGIM